MKLALRMAACAALLALVVASPTWANAPERAPGRSAGPDAVAGEVVLQLAPDAFHGAAFRADLLSSGRTGLAELDARLASLQTREIAPLFDLRVDAQRKQAMGMDRIFVVRYASDVAAARVAARLTGLVEVAYVEPNGFYHAMLSPNDTYYPNQWAHNNTGQAVKYGGGLVGTADCDTDTDQAWDLQIGSSALVLAIIDTGVDTTHPEFAGRIVAGYDFVNNDSNPMDDGSHGTCCSGIAVGAGNNAQGIAGVAWNVKLMPVKVLNSSGSGTYTAVANGITWAADNGAKVLSLSLGGGASSTVETAVNYAYGRGCAIFCAAGNSNRGSLDYPAAYANAIAVGALSPCNERKSTSSCDGETWWGSNYGTGLDFLAPGVRIHTTDIRGSGGYGSGDYITDFNGTSSATPHAAGIAALVWSQNAALTNAQLLSVLQTTCDDLGTAGYDTQTGYGRMNAFHAVQDAGGGGTPTPVTIFAEGFESNVVPGTVWSATDSNTNSGLDYWGDQSSSTGARVHGGSYSAYCADYSNVSGQKYDNNMNADMTLINPITLAGYTNVSFSFWLRYTTPNSSDYVAIQHWSGTAWTEQQRWSGSVSNWVNPTYTLTGFTTFKFRFIFYSNSSTTREGVYVDDIAIVGTPPAAARVDGPPTIAWVAEPSEPARAEAVAAAPRAGSELSIAWTRGNRPQAQLAFVLAQPAPVRLEVFGVDGRRVALLADATLTAGSHAFAWPGEGAREASSGVYYARLAVNGAPVASRPLVLVK
jgi:subtilisin family serine protease